MAENFNIEIISPEFKLLAEKVNSVTIPGYEGDMTILKDHIPVITFLRPGIIEVLADKERKYFVRCLEKENSVYLLNMINRIILLCSHTLGLGLKKKRWRVFGYCQFHTSLILEWSFLFTFNKILKLSSYF